MKRLATVSECDVEAEFNVKVVIEFAKVVVEVN